MLMMSSMLLSSNSSWVTTNQNVRTIFTYYIKKEIFSYITLLCSLSTRQAPKPLRVTVKKHLLSVHSYFFYFVNL